MFVLGGWSLGLSSAVALAAVALLGYLFGRKQRQGPESEGRGEIGRAMRIAHQLEHIADGLRHELALHRSMVDRFKSELRRVEDDPSSEAWSRLRGEADSMVAPTLRLVSQLSSAYDKIRLQSQSLTHFTGGRTDPLTGLANSRSLEEQLAVLLKSAADGGGVSSVVVVSLDNRQEAPLPTEEWTPDGRVRAVGKQVASVLRGEDFAARYGVDDFVIVLPATTLTGAGVFGRRLRASIGEQLGVSISCGIAESLPADTPRSLLSRADSAAYSAQAAGPGQQYVHTGVTIRAEGPAVLVEADERQDPPATALAIAVDLPGPVMPGASLTEAQPS